MFDLVLIESLGRNDGGTIFSGYQIIKVALSFFKRCPLIFELSCCCAHQQSAEAVGGGDQLEYQWLLGGEGVHAFVCVGRVGGLEATETCILKTSGDWVRPGPAVFHSLTQKPTPPK